MKLSALFNLAFVANIVTASFIALPSANASTFDEQEIAQENMIAIAVPYHSGYNLVVIEQIPGKDKCWAEQGTTAVAVEPLLMNFDFSGHCRRATDTNGYSLRINGEEKGSDYLLEVVERDNELILVATHRDPDKLPVTIGSTRGKSDGFVKIFLNDGWRFTKRSYEGQELSHFYFSGRTTSTTAETN